MSSGDRSSRRSGSRKIREERCEYMIRANPILGFAFSVCVVSTKREAMKECRRLQKRADKHKDGTGHRYSIRRVYLDD